ncbi:deoxyribonuclease V [candidate division KSB1 bacterium]|nr:deoxyribonuclease V [candidate division KSB1 bacterium]
MKIHWLHEWDIGIDTARRIQQNLAHDICSEPLRQDIRTISGADVSYSKNSNAMHAAVIVFKLPELDIVETASASARVIFPYIPGLLSFREAPVLLQAFSKLEITPDVALFDGQGIAHPLKLGLAAHVGLFLDVPTTGCAKTRLIGEFEEPDTSKGARSALIHHGKKIGVVLRTRQNIKPVFVSPGYKMDIEGAAEVVMRTVRGYRLPEPTRQAHLMVNRIRRMQ